MRSPSRRNQTARSQLLLLFLLAGSLTGAGHLAAADTGKSDSQKLLDALAQGLANAAKQQLEKPKAEQLAAQAKTANTAGNFTEGLRLADEALRADATNITALFGKGRALIGLKRYDESIAHFEAALKRFPASAQLHYGTAQAYDYAKQWQKAILHYEWLSQAEPKDPDWPRNIGQNYFELGDKERAIAEYRKALAIDPNNLESHRYLAGTLTSVGRTEEAIAEYETLLRLKPDDAEAKKKLESARQRLAQGPAVAATTGDAPAGANADALAKRATAANAAGDSAQALKLAEDALRTDSTHEGALVEKGKALREVGRLPEAITHLTSAVERRPESAPLHNTLGVTLKVAQQPQPAKVHFQAAVRLDPRNARYRNNLGDVCLELGELERAVAELKEAQALDAGNGIVQRNLGRVYLAKKQGAEAAAQFETALRLLPGDEQAQAGLEAARALPKQAPANEAEEGEPAGTPESSRPARAASAGQSAPEATALSEALREWANRMAPAKLAAALEDFRRTARDDCQSASLVFMTDEAAARFEDVRILVGPGWKYFFGGSVQTAVYPTYDAPLAVFYNPWADVALVTEWTETAGELRIKDAEFLTGDVLRQGGKGKLDPLPYWLRRRDAPPPQALARAGWETLESFRATFANAAPGAWRQELPALADSDFVTAAHVVASGTLLEAGPIRLEAFARSADLAELRRETDRWLQAAAGGRFAELWSVASGTRPATRTRLEGFPGDGWRRPVFLGALRGPQEAYVFLGFAHEPAAFLSLRFKVSPGGLQPDRVDWMNHDGYARLLAEGGAQ